MSQWLEPARRHSAGRLIARLRRGAGRAGLTQNNIYQVEGLERRLFLSSAIAAFAAQQTFSTGQAPDVIAAADVNVDGKMDLVVSKPSGTIGILLGNGNGTFQPQRTIAAPSFPTALAVADVNGDGKPDVVVANNNNPGSAS